MILLVLEAEANKRATQVAEYKSGNTQPSIEKDGRSLSNSQQYGSKRKPPHRSIQRRPRIRRPIPKPSLQKLIRKFKIRKPFNRRRQMKKPYGSNNRRKPLYKPFPTPRRRRPSRLPNPRQNELLTRPATQNCKCLQCKPIYRKIQYHRQRSVDESLESRESNRNRTIRSAHAMHNRPLRSEQVSKVSLEKVQIRADSKADKCEFQKKITCDENSKYRTIDGSCNNLANPYWGKAGTPLVRFVCSAYDDGVGAPRQRGIYGSLPEPRKVRLAIHERSDKSNEERKYTHFLMGYGQLLSHDILDNVVSRKPDGGRFDCCEDDKTDINCIMPLKIRTDDPFFGRFGRTCLNFARSKSSPDLACNAKIRQTINGFTTYIDASTFYGSDSESCAAVREFKGGRLKTQNHPDGEGDLMPAGSRGCRVTNPELKCFLSGDRRVNQQATLSGQHTVWLREHNRIAKKLEELFGRTWDDEKIFQEARRIVVAIFQHITYNEYLPAILGKKIMKLFDLKPKDKGECSDDYDPCVDPCMRHGFMAAAFRFGHSMINDHVGFKSTSGKYSRRPFKELFLKSDPLYQSEGLEQVMRGLYIEHSQSVDRLKSDQITNHLFERDAGTGGDLIATNINRGRDHGLPNYMEFRKMCGLSTTRTFSGLRDHSRKTRRLLRQVYANVFDMDLFTAGVAEEPLEGAVVGPTFACIIGLQFKALKFGDRFYYENDDSITGFTLAQLDDIKKNTMAQVICRNTNIGKIQTDVFRHGLPEVDCSDIEEEMDFSLWRDVLSDG
ncbi:chorion peroxidase-like [Ostrea edulis]|uniref:chorion peroxidase-like n=1 Tax=Ostrea edulis TaxID=37623 RepID=UPI0024AEB64F|nr:chorion peroxidase-like [Ostrea edulis]